MMRLNSCELCGLSQDSTLQLCPDPGFATSLLPTMLLEAHPASHTIQFEATVLIFSQLTTRIITCDSNSSDILTNSS